MFRSPAYPSQCPTSDSVAQNDRNRSRSTSSPSSFTPASDGSCNAATTASTPDQSSSSSLVFFSIVPRYSGVKSLTVPSYRFPSALSKCRASMGFLISSK